MKFSQFFLERTVQYSALSKRIQQTQILRNFLAIGKVSFALYKRLSYLTRTSVHGNRRPCLLSLRFI